MFTRQRLIIYVIIVLTGISSAFCDGTDVPQKITCSGKLVDDANKAVAGVKVKLHMLVPDAGGLEIGDVNTEEQITKDDGSFSFSVEKLADRTYRMGIVVVQKDGFAICWDNWDMRKDKVLTLSLEKPYKLQGVVVDDANKPVADAEVRISMLIVGDISGRNNEGRYLTAVKHLDMLKTTTDANGIFVFKDIPAAGKAEFMVTKVGRATVSTFVFNPSNYNPGQYTVESKDIKIIQPVEAKIEGKVVESGTEKPVGGVKVTCVVEPRVGASGIKPVVSKEDGTFTFDGLEAKTYTVRGASSQKGTAQWVIEPANVTTTAGRTNSDVVIKASKGGVLEIIVRDNENKNIAGVNVHIRAKDIPQGQGGITDSNGVATIRLAPGEYELQGTYKEGYSSPKDRQTATVEDGKTTRLEIELKGSPKISGIVTDDKGKPLADATIQIFPMGRTQNVKSDTNGKFEVAWNPERWGGNQEIQYLLVARHIGRNLAVAVDIDEDTKTIDVKMSQGIVIKGKIVDANSKPLADAKLHVNLHISNWGTYVDQDGIKADAQGMYEYKALPDEQRYSVSAQADGYGQSYAEVLTEDAVDGLVEIEPMILKLAVMSVSGVVKDGNDKPVAGVDVIASGVASASIGISVSKFANSMKITLTNNGAAPATITTFQAKGLPVKYKEPVRVSDEDTTSQGKYGIKTYKLPGPWLPDTNNARDFCRYVISRYKDPLPVIQLSFKANKDERHMIQALNRKISDRVKVRVTSPRIPFGINGEFFIEAISHRITQWGGVHEVFFDLSDASGDSGYWILGVTGFSELGETTRVGY